MQLTGIHHLTAISAKPRDNLAFYTGTLGMRLVKKTVNQDDVSAYHLFYADGEANPGTDLTFFDFPAAPERRGSNSISRTGLRVAGENSLSYWRDRLKQAGGHTGEITEVDGRLTLPFEDREGQRLVLVDDGGAGPAAGIEQAAPERRADVDVDGVTLPADAKLLLLHMPGGRDSRRWENPGEYDITRDVVGKHHPVVLTLNQRRTLPAYPPQGGPQACAGSFCR